MLKVDDRLADAALLLLYIAVCTAILFRVSIESTGYTSPDSEYYMEAARSLRDGERFVIKDLYGLHTGDTSARAHFTAWPVGYPTLIYLASSFSQLDFFWASKLLNLLFIGFGFLLMRHINRQYSFVLASIYCAFTILEMYSYTWSEGIFMFGCLCFAYLLYRVYISGKTWLVYMLLTAAAFMFLIRYIGFFAGGLILLLALITWFENGKRVSKQLFIAFVLNVVFVCVYIWHNHYLAGYNTDVQRLTEHMESPEQVLWMAVRGLTIELFLIRKFYLHGLPDVLTLAAAVLQFCVMVYIWWAIRKQPYAITEALKQNILSHTAIVVALAYLVVLVFLRAISQFDPPNYRLLSPFTFLVLFAAVNYIVALPAQSTALVRAKVLIFCFFAISLLLNLPKEYILSQLLHL